MPDIRLFCLFRGWPAWLDMLHAVSCLRFWLSKTGARRVPGNGVRRLAYTGSYLRVPVSALRGVEALDDAHGWTGIGAGFVPGAFAA
jgi:hypothetical protein